MNVPNPITEEAGGEPEVVNGSALADIQISREERGFLAPESNFLVTEDQELR